MEHDDRIGASQEFHTFEQFPCPVLSVDEECAYRFYDACQRQRLSCPPLSLSSAN